MQTTKAPEFIFRFLALAVVLLAISACQTAYYGTMEKFGVHKRDIMVARVVEARDAQEEAKEQFRSALEKFSSVVKFKGGSLQEKYDTLKKEYDESESKGRAVSSRIEKIEDVSEALFAEWEEELQQYSSTRLREDSRKKLARTKSQYKLLIAAMKKAEKKIDPVLAAFKDQVLYLKHNLNAQAIASLQNELLVMEDDIAGLIREIESSIKETNAFLATLTQ